MSAEVLAFRSPDPTPNREDLLGALVDLHSLITIDPVMGASPVRIYFVLNPAAKAKIAECVEDVRRPHASAYALVAFDFPFALHVTETSAPQLPLERAKAIVDASAKLQGELLQSAADAMAIEADPVMAFDADALKRAFFPNTQESVTHAFRLELRRRV
jgi:hypothetical protein